MLKTLRASVLPTRLGQCRWLAQALQEPSDVAETLGVQDTPLPEPQQEAVVSPALFLPAVCYTFSSSQITAGVHVGSYYWKPECW